MELREVKLALSSVISKLSLIENIRKRLSSGLKSISHMSFSIAGKTSESLFNKVEKIKPNFSAGGVDGGLLTKSFHGIDLIITRAIGVVIWYENGKIVKNKRVGRSAPLVIEKESSNEGELIAYASLYRTQVEVERAIELVQKHSPDFLFMDGPLYPHPSTRMSKGDNGRAYSKLIKLYEQLHKECEKTGTKLIGVVEDTRSSLFSNIFHDKILPALPISKKARFKGLNQKFRDTSLLFDSLTQGERTFTFKLVKTGMKYEKELYGFYIKPAKYDRPVRIEFIAKEPGKLANEVATATYSLCVYKSYGLPSVIIEADARAKLNRNLIEYITRILRDKTGSPMLLNLRREQRPL
ncbi:MAG: DNA double-strand break repair nuclease NurA [Candidatus Altiarchaeota archaeon]|nr:DNA double-strand break repair nuclease NurA [Candidatus Altiarchaeota archaeon]